MQFANFADDYQPESRAFDVAIPFCIDTVIRDKEPVHIFWSEADPMILHAEMGNLFFHTTTHENCTPIRRILHGVRQEIEDDLRELITITVDWRKCRIQLKLKGI